MSILALLASLCCIMSHLCLLARNMQQLLIHMLCFGVRGGETCCRHSEESMTHMAVLVRVKSSRVTGLQQGYLGTTLTAHFHGKRHTYSLGN